MRNGTFFIGENKHLADAVAFCAARAFFTTEIQMFPQPDYLIKFGYELGAEAAGAFAAPATPSSPSNQPQRFLAGVGNVIRSCRTQPFSPILIIRLEKLSSKLLASDTKPNQCWSNCAAAKALRVLENRTQGNRLSPFVQRHLISPAAIISVSSMFSFWERRRPAGQSGVEKRNLPARRRRSQDLSQKFRLPLMFSEMPQQKQKDNHLQQDKTDDHRHHPEP
jgi:hypothetical protein